MSWPGSGLAEWMRCLAGSLSSWLARHQDCSAQQLAGQTDGWQASQYVSQTACQLAMQPSSQLPSQPTSHGPGWQAGILYNVAASTLRQIITKMRFPRRGIHLVLGSCPEGDKFALIASREAIYLCTRPLGGSGTGLSLAGSSCLTKVVMPWRG